MALSFDDEAPTSSKLVFDDEEGKSVGGFAKNAGKDVMDIGSSLGGFAKKALTQNPATTLIETMIGIPEGIYKEGERLGLTNLMPGKQHLGISDVANKFGNAVYDKPVSTALDILPAFGGGKQNLAKGVELAPAAEAVTGVAKAAEAVAPVVDDVARVATKAPAALEMPAEAAQILKEALPPAVAPTPTANPAGAAGAAESVPLGSTFQETVSNLGKKIPEEVKQPLNEVTSYLESKFGKAAKTPGAVENFGKALEQKARGMRLKEIGGSPGQVRMLRDRFGEGVVNDLADLADKKGITKGFFNWQTGNEIKNLTSSSGSKIGAIRDVASKRGAIHSPDSLVQKIRAELDPIYMNGTGSSQKGAYMKALEDIRKAPKDASSFANLISDKQRFLKKNRLTQPITAGTDVFNAASRFNNELIGKFLNPTETQLYKESLKDFSAAKVFDKMYGFTYGRDMAGRSGPASPLNFIKDVGGRKVMEKVFSNVGKRMQRSPETFGSPLELGSDVLDSIDQALDEIIHQMGKGETPP